MSGPPHRHQDNEDNDDDARTNGAAAAAAADEPSSAELQRMVQQLQQELRAQRNETLRVQRELDEERLRRFHTGAATAAIGTAASPPERASESNQFTENSLRRTLLQIQSSAAPTTADNERFRRFQRWMVTKTLPVGVALQSDVSDTVIKFLMPSLLVASANSSKSDVAQFVATETDKAGGGAAYVLRQMWLAQAIASAIDLIVPSEEVDGMLDEEQKRRQEETLRQRDVMCTMTAGITKHLPQSWTILNALKDWSGVTLDSSDNVTEIKARETNMEGELNWSLLLELPQLRVLDLSGHKLSGIFNTTEQLRSLPLVVLDLNRADMSGSRLIGVFDLSHLPAGLRGLNLQGNNFMIKNWSSVNQLTALVVLWLPENDLASAGNIDFSLLPRTLYALGLQFCRFEQGAAADIARLPAGIIGLFLDHTTNLTVFCSDISMFAQLKLDDKSKERFHTLKVALGRIGDPAAPVVSGKRLLEFATSGAAHDAIVAAETQRQAATAVASTAASASADRSSYETSVLLALTVWNGIYPGTDHGLGSTLEEIVSNALHRGKRPPCRGVPSDDANTLHDAFDPDASRRPSIERLSQLAQRVTMLSSNAARSSYFDEWHQNQDAVAPLREVANDDDASSGEASTGVARQPHGNEGPASLQNRWLRGAGPQPSTGASSSKPEGESRLGSDEVGRREELLSEAREREEQEFAPLLAVDELAPLLAVDPAAGNNNGQAREEQALVAEHDDAGGDAAADHEDVRSEVSGVSQAYYHGRQ